MDGNFYVAVKAEYLRPKASKPEVLLPPPSKNEVEQIIVEAQSEAPPQAAATPMSVAAADTTPTTTTTEGITTTTTTQSEEVPTNKKRKHDVKEGKEKVSLKKRHQKTHPEKEDRLCSFVLRGESCPYTDHCQYSHDIFAYLSKKPADLGPVCLIFEKFGYCPSGITCRFAASHIDPSTGRNLSRPAEQGGVIERQQINVLKKTTQLLLRKKNIKGLVATTPSTTSSTTPVETTTTNTTTIEDDMVNLTAYPDKPVKLVDFRNKVYVAPLTTVGNLPFRRVLKDFGADITCGEMAMANNILAGQASEWALLRRHESEDVFGIQVAGPYPNMMTDLSKDLNCGCPIDVVCQRGSGSALLNHPKRLCDIIKTMAEHMPSRSITVKVRIGHDEKNPTTHKLIPSLQAAAPGRLSAIMIHGRSRLQRYHKLANWDYVLQCAKAQDLSLPTVPIIGNGDIFSFYDWQQHLHLMTDYRRTTSSFVNSEMSQRNNEEVDSETLGLCSCAMLGRGALIKPWLPLEIKEQRIIDISATERLDMLKTFCNYGLEHWGSDDQGIATTRRFLLEWLSFLHRYVPAGLLEYKSAAAAVDKSGGSNYLGVNGNASSSYQGIKADDVYAQTMNQRPPQYFGRCDLESLLSSGLSVDWIRISEMLLGPVKEDFHFIPKHKTNSYPPEPSVNSSANVATEQEEEEDDLNNG
eukprot:scaffold1365_cov163-Ochromonas_danica.AAC.65